MRTIARTFAALLLPLGLGAHAFAPSLTGLDAIPLQTTDWPSIQAKIRSAVDDPQQTRRFAVGTPSRLSLADGLWDTASDGRARWRMRVYSAGAQSLNFEFAELALPPPAELWIYDTGGKLVQGPYAAADLTPGTHFWSALVTGDSAVLELHVPPALRKDVRLQLARINHGFRGFGAAGTIAKSGSCNIDVVCPLGDGWRGEIRSAARITIGGQYVCSGQLVNNTRQDDDPLFLTADHCGVGDSLLTSAASVVVYWNYQTSVCNGTPDGSLSQNQSGSTLLADDVTSDFTLLRLNQEPASAFNVYYAGWDVSGRTPSSGVAIHHPSGDEKRISAFATPASRQDGVCIESGLLGNCARSVNTWQVVWSQGTTEQGSSGSGLWNGNHRLVGVLSGGGASCSDPEAPDFFGRLEAAWTAGSADNAQLKAHLDPDNTGITSLPGKNPGEVVDVGDDGGSDGGGGSGGGALPGAVLALLYAAAALRRRNRSRG